MSKKITKKTKFSEIIKYPEATELLMEKGMHCFGCPFAHEETLEQGAKSHGMDADKIVNELNQIKIRRKKKK